MLRLEVRREGGREGGSAWPLSKARRIGCRVQSQGRPGAIRKSKNVVTPCAGGLSYR